ncbi:MAG: lipolytic enzyme family, partial [Nocardioides sp.]|nr:lipolytic enzyme family [Nocardioides sp.]
MFQRLPTPGRSTSLALVGLGVVGLVGGAAAGGHGLLRRQAAGARALIGKPLGEEALVADRTWKKKYGDRVDLLLLGDSIAAGLGAETARRTLGARLARSLARSTHRAVR